MCDLYKYLNILRKEKFWPCAANLRACNTDGEEKRGMPMKLMVNQGKDLPEIVGKETAGNLDEWHFLQGYNELKYSTTAFVRASMV